ncbi:cytochrome C [Geobacter sulfurreducens]|jgi:hypothetical protein|uniref:Cytochrome c n=1 Tax=Geobacter sulfurreducens (strain ATCC 51573 / DSM 12127 / PCA) TaxID=243231 RepID=Q749H6_GEOSL|nr:cytochrome c [Geobacter sulfurreducens]AAR36161.1 cytochrome c [Geobacter sulfurreducens PCA]ADI85519.1 cytochrome c, 2 heme-binding sites [Geobacter sulfurreducens KN400]AJY69032.1 cytochrome C [Geobacter sulfurreducens]QVW34584.1 cytochrome C [Geobacter sulfurreducens]UAC03453.1 cytochrome C [Geobacter sulfurreducens]
MKLSRRDGIFLVIILALITVLVLNRGSEQGKPLPADDAHRPFSEALARGADRETTEQGCVRCHATAARPLPPGHPPKEQCLFCHRPAPATR